MNLNTFLFASDFSFAEGLTLDEVYAMASELGFDHSDVCVEADCFYDDEADEVAIAGYNVTFGSPWDYLWSWFFYELDEPAVEFEFSECED